MTDRPGDRLRAARLSQRREDGEPWSQDNFLDIIEAETHWRPAYKNYLDTERGQVQPKPETWRKFVAFYKAHDVDLDTMELPEPEPEAAPPVMDVPAALIALARAWEAERARLEDRIDELSAMVQVMAERSRPVRGSGGRATPDAPRGSEG